MITINIKTMQYYSFKEITSSYTKEKRKRSSLWARCFSRPLSFPITWVFINIGLSANQVSILSMLEALVACAMIMLGGTYTLIGVGLFVFWHVLDCVDGNIARVKKQSSYAGAFLDAASGYIAPAFVFLSVGTAAFHTTTFSDYNYWFIIMGGISSASDVLARMIYQRYLVTEFRVGLIGKSGDIDQVRSSGIAHIADLIMKNMSYSCLYMPLLILSAIFNRFDLLTILYFLYTVLVLIATFVMFIRKAFTLDKRIVESGKSVNGNVIEF